MIVPAQASIYPSLLNIHGRKQSKLVLSSSKWLPGRHSTVLGSGNIKGQVRIRASFNIIPSQPIFPFLLLLKVPWTSLPISFFSATISCLHQRISFCVSLKHRIQSLFLKTRSPSEDFFFLPLFLLEYLELVTTGKQKSRQRAQAEFSNESIYQQFDSRNKF